MRKIFAIFAATLIAFCFASCEKPAEPGNSDSSRKKDTTVIPPIPEPLTFNFDIEVLSTMAFWNIYASDTSVWFYGSYNSLEYFNETYSSIEEAPQQIMDGWKEDGITFDDLLNTYRRLNKGVWGGGNIALKPNTEYIIYVFPIDTALNVTGEIAYQTFTTLPEGYVDLGLPSGTLWKKESEPSLWNDYEDAIVEFGDAIPSQTQWEELINNCTWTYNADQGAYIIRGKNGNTISMDCAGYRYCDGSSGHPSSTEGWYWTSTSTDEDNAYAAFFTHYETYDNITTDEMPKCNGFSVHLICVKK